MIGKTIQLSPNSLNLFLECSHCFWLDKNLGIKRPPPYPYALNSAVDTLLKEEFSRGVLFQKIQAMILISAGLWLLSMG